MPDHHVLESLLAFATIGLMCAAVESEAPQRWRLTAAAGVALGAYLATRPAGVFVPAALTVFAVLAPAMALPVAVTLAVGVVVFLPARESLWGSYTLLAMGACLGAALTIHAIDSVWRRRALPARMRPVAFAGAALLAVAAAWLVRPDVAHALAAEVWRRAGGLAGDTGAAHGVQELQPLVRSGEWAFGSLQAQFGTLWIAGLPALVWLIAEVWRTWRPVLILFTVWTSVAVAGVYTQLRMTVYSAPCAAILAGVGCAWILQRAGKRRTIAAAALAILLAATNVPGSVREMNVHYSANEDWRKALLWLRTHSPEPMGNPGAWYARYPRLAAGAAFSYPPSAYGVGVWWNYGYFVQTLAHRIPTTNGTQEGTLATGRFLTDPSPESAVAAMRAMGARYVMLDPLLLLFRPDRSIFGDIVTWAERPPRDYSRIYLVEANGQTQPVMVYLPDYYRSLLVRLYLYDGGAPPATETWLIGATPGEFLGGRFEVIRWRQRFDSYGEAEAYREAHRRENLILGSFNPVVSCVPLEPVDGVSRVYTSDDSPIERGRPLRAVKIFEVAEGR
jgi:asparagine N-glycosylation enzyme membrane subunit Stt3